MHLEKKTKKTNTLKIGYFYVNYLGQVEKRKEKTPVVFSIRNSLQELLLTKDYIWSTSVYEMEALKSKL